jgi:glycosyltransferase involved in cell wall biosynthesis
MLIGADASRAITRQRTGTEAYSLFLLKSLIPLAAEKGHRLRLYFRQTPPKGLFPEAGHVEQVVIPFPRLWTHLRLARELHRRPPDVFFTPAHVIPLSYRGPSVATVHDLGYHHFPDAHPGRQVLYLAWSTRHNGRRSRRVIADSRATKNDLIHLYKLPPKKINVVYPGLDPELQPVEDINRLKAVHTRYGITPPYYLAIGTIHPRKNLQRLLKAFINSDVEGQLVLAGKSGWLAGPILDDIRVEQAKKGSGVLLPGFVPDEDKAALLSGATALLFPSLYEGFGFPVLEAQACGTPVLTSSTSSLPEIAGKGALLLDPLDSDGIAAGIRRITNDRPLRNKLIKAGFENVKSYTWERAAKQALRTVEEAGVQQD